MDLQSNYALRLHISLKAGAETVAREDSSTFNQFIVSAVIDKLACRHFAGQWQGAGRSRRRQLRHELLPLRRTGRATVRFISPRVNGSSNIISYSATCSASGQTSSSESGSSCPITVFGLVGGVVYTCSVFATNSAGNSAASGSLPVTPRPDTNIIPLLILLLF